MPEPTWARTGVPPLRADIDGRLRALRRAEAGARRFLALGLVGLLGSAVGAIAALQPENFL